MTPIQASNKVNKKLEFSNHQHIRQRMKPNNHLVVIFRTADIKNVFSKGDSTIWSYE